MDSTRYLKVRSHAFKRTSPLSIVQTKTTGSVKMVTATTTTMTPVVSFPSPSPSSSLTSSSSSSLNIGSKNLLSDCCVPGCSSSKYNSERLKVDFHPFPGHKIVRMNGKGVEDRDMRSIWIRILFPHGIHGSIDLPFSSMMVCSKHFRVNDYYKKEKNKSTLRPNAIPTLFLGHNLSISEILKTMCDSDSEPDDPPESMQPSRKALGIMRIKQEVNREEDDGEIITPDFDEVPQHQVHSDLSNQFLIDATTPVDIDPGNRILIDDGTPVIFATEDDLLMLDSEGRNLADEEDIEADKYSLTDAFIKSIELMKHETGSKPDPTAPSQSASTSISAPSSGSRPASAIITKPVKIKQSLRGAFKTIKRPLKILPKGTTDESRPTKMLSSTVRKGMRLASPSSISANMKEGSVKYPAMTPAEISHATKTAAFDHSYCDFEIRANRRDRLKQHPEKENTKMEMIEPLAGSTIAGLLEDMPKKTNRILCKEAIDSQTENELLTARKYYEYYISQIRLAISYKYKKATTTSKLNDLIPCPYCTHPSTSVGEIQEHLKKHLREPPKMFKCALCSYGSVFYESLVNHDENIHYNIEREGKTMKELSHAEIFGLLGLVSRSRGISPEFNLFTGAPWKSGKLERFWPIVTKEFNRMYPPIYSGEQFRSELFLKCRFYTLKKLTLKIIKQELGRPLFRMSFDEEIVAMRTFVEDCVKAKRSIFDKRDSSKSSEPSLTPTSSSSPSVVDGPQSPKSTVVGPSSQSALPSDGMPEVEDCSRAPSKTTKPLPGQCNVKEEKEDLEDESTSPSSPSKKVSFTLGEESKIIQSLPGRKEVFIVDINKITKPGFSSASIRGESSTLISKHVVSTSVASKFELSAVERKPPPPVSSPKKRKASAPSATDSFPCLLCSSEFKLQKNLDKHMVWHRDKAERAVAQSMNQALAHLNPAIANTFNCDCCDFSAVSKDELDDHMSSHFRVAEEKSPDVEEVTLQNDYSKRGDKEDDEMSVVNDDDDVSNELVFLESESKSESGVDESSKSESLSRELVRKKSAEESRMSLDEDFGESDSEDESSSSDDYSESSDALEYSDNVESDPDFDELALIRVERSKVKNSKEFKTLKKELEEERYWEMMAKKSFEKQMRPDEESDKTNSVKRKRRRESSQRTVKALTDELIKKKLSKTSSVSKAEIPLTTASSKRVKPKKSESVLRKSATSSPNPSGSPPKPKLSTSPPKLSPVKPITPREVTAAPLLSPAITTSAPSIESSPLMRRSPKSSPLKSKPPIEAEKLPKLGTTAENRLQPAIVDEAAASLAVTAVVHPSERVSCDKCSFAGNANQLRLHQTWAHSSWSPKSSTVNSDFAARLFKKRRRRKLDSLHSVCSKKKKKPSNPKLRLGDVGSQGPSSDTATTSPRAQLSSLQCSRKKKHRCFYCIYVCFSRKDMINHIAEQRHLEPITYSRKRAKIVKK